MARWAAGATLIVILFVGFIASSAGAKIIVDKATGQKLSILAPPSRLATRTAKRRATPLGTAGTPTCSTALDPTCKTVLSYHGGPVQHAENDYLFFWDPNGFAAAPGYEAGMQAWLSDLAASDYTTGNTAPFVGNPVSVAQEYYDLSGAGKTKRFVPYDVSNAGTIADTNPFPASGCTDASFATCLTQAQLSKELSTYITDPAHPYPTGLNTEYFILTPPGVGGCSDSQNSDCFVTNFCAWHSLGSTAQGRVIYAFQPYLYQTGCDVNQQLGHTNIYTNGVDAAVGTFSHELSETMTDPTLNGWYSGNFDEIGDKCAYQYDLGKSYYVFSDLPQTGGGAFYNTTLGSDNYLLQEEFNNRADGCNQYAPDKPPTATVVAPAGATTGAPAKFSLSNVKTTGNVGVAYVKWNFGDGTSATSIGSAAVNHYYQAANTYPVSAVITDNRGNEVQVPGGSSVAVAAPTPQQLQSAVNAVIKPSGAGAKIENLLTNGGYALSFSALTKGTFHMAWTRGTTIVATVTRALSILGPDKLKLTLTSAGRTLLNHSQQVKNVHATDTFTPTVGSPVTDSSVFTLVR